MHFDYIRNKSLCKMDYLVESAHIKKMRHHSLLPQKQTVVQFKWSGQNRVETIGISVKFFFFYLNFIFFQTAHKIFPVPPKKEKGPNHRIEKKTYNIKRIIYTMFSQFHVWSISHTRYAHMKLSMYAVHSYTLISTRWLRTSVLNWSNEYKLGVGGTNKSIWMRDKYVEMDGLARLVTCVSVVWLGESVSVWSHIFMSCHPVSI